MSATTRRWLSLDISLTCTGWAVLEGTKDAMELLDYGHIKTVAKKGKTAYTTGQRLRTIYDAMTDLVARYPDVDKQVPREAGFVKFANATKQIQRATGVCEMALSDFELIDVNPSVPKKWARDYLGISYNRVDKEMVEEAVRAFLKLPDLQFVTDDESDAVAVGLVYGLGLHEKEKAGGK